MFDFKMMTNLKMKHDKEANSSTFIETDNLLYEVRWTDSGADVFQYENIVEL